MHMKKEQMHYLHLGCFDQPTDGWYNTDITPHIFISKIPCLPWVLRKLSVLDEKRYLQHKTGIFRNIHYVDLRRRLPFKDNSVDAVFSSHVIEHLYIYESNYLFKEILRILRPGGWVRFVLPDLENIVNQFQPQSPELFLESIYENINPSLAKNQHHWMFTAPYLSRLLECIGFKNIKQKKYQESECELFIPLDNRPENSFYLEAQK